MSAGIKFSDVSWYKIMFMDVSWYKIMFTDVSWYKIMFTDVSWYKIMFTDVSWCKNKYWVLFTPESVIWRKKEIQVLVDSTIQIMYWNRKKWRS